MSFNNTIATMDDLQLESAPAMVSIEGPQSTADLETFTIFLKLPIELRRKIWGYALPGPRVIEIIYVNDRAPLTSHGFYDDIQFIIHPHHLANRGGAAARAEFPMLLHVCQESQSFVLEHYQLGFAGHLRHQIYVDFANDLLWFVDSYVRIGFLGSRYSKWHEGLGIEETPFRWMKTGTEEYFPRAGRTYPEIRKIDFQTCTTFPRYTQTPPSISSRVAGPFDASISIPSRVTLQEWYDEHLKKNGGI
jgi:hypothetical protein